jgi:hypothetical protein
MLRSLCLPFLVMLLAAGVCYAGSLPEIDVQTGLITNGPIYVNQQFAWVKSSQGTCSVTTGSNPQWFSPDPVTVPAASGGNTGTVVVTATAVGTFTWASPCSLVQSPKAPIQGMH